MKRKLLNGIRFCKHCGARMLLQGYNSQHRLARTMEKKMICYECAFWQDILDYPPEHLEVVGSKCLRIYPVADKHDRTLILGGKGKMRYFMRPDKSLFQSNDIWNIGTIPQRFISKFQKSAIEITSKAYRQLKRNNKKCRARACLDRYHCFRYDRELERDCDSYNSIPPKWKIGDEHCGAFISFDDILNDKSSVNQNLQIHHGKENQQIARTSDNDYEARG